MIKETLEDLIRQLQHYANNEEFLKDAEEFYQSAQNKFSTIEETYYNKERFEYDFGNAFLVNMVSQLRISSSKDQVKMEDAIKEYIYNTDWWKKIPRVKYF